jgi:hypothetical protein
MKSNLILLSIFFFSIVSCSKSTLSPSTAGWQVGEDEQEITKSFDITDQDKCTITLTSLSYCSNSGVEIQITENGKSIYTKSVIQFPFKDTIVIKPNSNISVTTKSFVNLLSSFACIRQGKVSCEVEF